MTCPICDKETVSRYRPFCSRRCADRDLGNWFSGRYFAPAEDAERSEDEPFETEEPEPSRLRVLH